MRETFILLFLIVSYNFLLWYITEYEISPVPLFPQDIHHIILVLSYNSVLYISWLFGERHRTVQWIGYLFFFQIIALSFYFRSLEIVVRDLPPVIFTFALLALLESPTEKEIKGIEKEREELLSEIDRVREEREYIETQLRLLKEEIKNLEEEKKEEGNSEGKEKLEEKLKELQDKLKEYKEKENRLLETNRRLFQLLDILRSESEINGGKKELSSLRKERKKLIKELIQLQELVDLYTDESEKLKEEKEKLLQERKRLQERVESLEEEIKRLRHKEEKVEEIYMDFFLALGVSISQRALGEFIRLTPERKKSLLREILRFSLSKEKNKAEPLKSVKGIYKLRFQGGRVYIRRNKNLWDIVGVLDSEDDKEKERYIRNILSKIV